MSGWTPFLGWVAVAVAAMVWPWHGTAAPRDDETGGAASAGDTAISATELAPPRVPLPASVATTPVEVDERVPVAFETLVARIVTASGVPAAIEERPSRTAGGEAALPSARRLRLTYGGTFAGLLDRVARLSGYEWSWSDDDGVVFFRYRDADWVAERGLWAASAARDPAAGGPWTVDTVAHATLRDVLESWAGDAGWSLVWRAEGDYALSVDASFEGSFLAAVDVLLAAPATRRALLASAYPANRQLVIEDAGSAVR